MTHRSMRFALPLSLAVLAGLAQAAPLTFTAALEQAERASPALSALRAQTGAAQAAAQPAGALPDPKLLLGVDNYPVSGPMRGAASQEPMFMQKIGLMQEFPNSAKRRARIEAATAEIEAAEAQQRAQRLKTRREAALAWLNRYALERKLALFPQLEQENRLFAATMRAQIASGRALASDAVLPQQEAAQLADRRDDLERDLARARAELRRLLGPAGDEALAGTPPALELDAAALRRQLQHHPELTAFGAQTRQAEAALHEAQAGKRPDIGVELAYQKRARQFGNMVSLQFTVDLPLFSGARQDPQITAKRLELDKVEAEREALLRDHANELDATLADYTALNRQLERARSQWLPLARQKLNLALAGYQAGKTEAAALVSARSELTEQHLKLIELENQRASAAAKLHYAYGENAQ